MDEISLNLKKMCKNVPLFCHFKDKQINEIISIGEEIYFKEGKTVFQEGSDADSLYVIIGGRVKVYKKDANGEEVVLGNKGAGEFFGELSILDGGKRSASVSTIEPCKFFLLKRQGFLNLLVQSENILTSVFGNLIKDIRVTTNNVFKKEIARRNLQSEMEIQRHKSLAQMVAGVAHELNTPLGISNTAVDMISKQLTSDDIKVLFDKNNDTKEVFVDISEAIRLTLKNLDRAHKLVQNFKHISVSQITDKREKIVFLDLVEEIIDLFKVNARQAKLKIEIRNELDDPTIKWDGYPGYLNQVLMNILTNVERHAYPNGKGGNIEVNILEDNNRKIPAFILTCKDFGVGIPSKNLPMIFDVFFTTAHNRGGTGLGMAIVYNLVTSALKGSIEIDSVPNEETVVKITIPQVIPDDRNN